MREGERVYHPPRGRLLLVGLVNQHTDTYTKMSGGRREDRMRGEEREIR
jgi:hypothetical protein